MPSAHCNAFVGIHKMDFPGTTIYVIIEERSAFDLIDLPENGNEDVRHKCLEAHGQYIVFQYWIKNVTTPTTTTTEGTETHGN